MRLFAVLIVLSASLAFGLDRPLRKGAIQLSMSYQTLDADRFFNLNEVAVPINPPDAGNGLEYSRERTNLQLDYGMYANVTVILAASYRSSDLNGFVDNSGTGDYYIGVRRLISAPGDNSRFVVETGVLFGGSGTDGALPLGADETDWLTVASYNQDFFPRGGFEMDFGYRFRGGDPEDEYFFNTSLAVGLGNLALAKARYRVVESRKEAPVEYGFLVWPDDRGSQIWGLELSRQVTAGWRVSVAWQRMHAGRHQYQTQGMDAGVSWIF